MKSNLLTPTHQTAPQPQTGTYASGPRLIAVARVGDMVRIQTQAQLHMGANAPFVVISDEMLPSATFDNHIVQFLFPLN